MNIQVLTFTFCGFFGLSEKQSAEKFMKYYFVHSSGALILKKAQEEDKEVSSIEKLLTPTKFTLMASVVNKISETDKVSPRLKAGPLISNLIKFLRNKARRLEPPNPLLVTLYDNVAGLKQEEWGTFVSARALADKEENSINNPTVMPSSSDMKLFATELDKKLKLAVKTYKEKRDYESYVNLQQITVVRTINLNKKRGNKNQIEILALFYWILTFLAICKAYVEIKLFICTCFYREFENF